MTITTTRTPRITTQALDEQTIKHAADGLLAAMTRAGLDNPRWESAGPLVSTAAQRLREALGVPIQGTCVSSPAVVREADFAMATRPLLGTPHVTDPGAARDFVRLADDARLALG